MVQWYLLYTTGFYPNDVSRLPVTVLVLVERSVGPHGCGTGPPPLEK